MATNELTIGKYQLINCIASGQSCQVWEVDDLVPSGRRVAMKLLTPNAMKEPESVAALKNEYNVGKKLDHPNLLKYYELSVTKEHAYFTMDVFRGGNLKNLIYNDLSSVHSRLKRLAELTVMALEYMHQKNWLHRDLKPENILTNRSTEVKLIDFSLSIPPDNFFTKMFGGKRPIQGTRTYLSPEQITSKPLGPASDLYSFGVVLFEMLCAQPPFRGSSPKDLLLKHVGERAPAPSLFNTAVTQEMDTLVLKLLEKKPENRFTSATEFLAELRRVEPFKVGEQDPRLFKKNAAEQSFGDEGRLDSRKDALRVDSKTSGGGAGGLTPAPASKPAPVAATAKGPAAAPAAKPAQVVPVQKPQVTSPATSTAPPAAKTAVPPPSRPVAAQPGASGNVQPPLPASRPASAAAPPATKTAAGPSATPPPSRAAQPTPAAAKPPASQPAAKPNAPSPKPASKSAAPATKSDKNVDSSFFSLSDLPEFDELPPVE